MTPSQRDLLERFRQARLREGELGHREHLQVAWIYLRCAPGESALEEFVRDLKRLVTALGAEEKYHATITWAFLLLIRERMERQGGGEDWQRFAAANPDLFEAGVLERYYRRETLSSELARRVFVLPDRHAQERPAA